MGRRLGGMVAAVAAFAACGHAQAGCKLGKLAELPITMVGSQPQTPARINGVEVRFLVDSGAFFSLISQASAAELHLATNPAPFGFYITGVGGTADVTVATVKTLAFDRSELSGVDFMVGGSEVGASAVGVLGQNILAAGDVEYDLAGGAVRLFRPQGCGGRPLAYWTGDKPFSTLPIESTDVSQRQTVGDVMVNGVRVVAMFDTGADTSILSLQAAARAGVRPDGPGVTFSGYDRGIGRHSVKTWIAPVASLQIGDETIKHTKIRIGGGDLTDVDMLIGADFFLAHRVYVANSQRKLYFTYQGGPVFNLSQQPAAAPPGPTVSTVASEPTDADSFSRRGAAFAARRDYDRAVADFGKAIDLAPTQPRYFYQRAMTQVAAQRPSLALADLDTELKLQPDDAQGRLERADLRLAQQDEDGAKADLGAADAAASKQADLRLRIGESYLELEQFGPAVAQLDLWIAAHGDDSRLASALNSRCWARALAGQALDKALADCNAAVRMSQRSAHALDTRGLVRLRRGEFDRAIADYDAALAQKPKLAWSLYGRGLAELKTGATAQGKADLAAAAVEAPRLAEQAAKLGLAP